MPAGFEGGQMPIHMRLPKLGGFTNRNRVEYQVVNVGDLAQLFPKGGTVGVEDLVAKGAVRKNELVKVLGDGELSVKLDITANKFSASARTRSPPPAAAPLNSEQSRRPGRRCHAQRVAPKARPQGQLLEFAALPRTAPCRLRAPIVTEPKWSPLGGISALPLVAVFARRI